jgi:soluble cytochrome b562
MKPSRILIAAAVLASAAAVLAAATTPLGVEMTAMGVDYTKLTLQIAIAGDSAQNLTLLQDLRTHASNARLLVPAQIESQPDQIEAYQAKIDELIQAIEKVEADLTAGDTAAAQADWAAVRQIRSEGHQAFKPNS